MGLCIPRESKPVFDRHMLAFLFALTLQAAPAADLAFLAGRWQGTLTYLDYKDNKTHVTLQATLTCTRTDGGLRYRFEYVEPNGKTVAGDETVVTISPDSPYQSPSPLPPGERLK